MLEINNAVACEDAILTCSMHHALDRSRVGCRSRDRYGISNLSVFIRALAISRTPQLKV